MPTTADPLPLMTVAIAPSSSSRLFKRATSGTAAATPVSKSLETWQLSDFANVRK